MTTTTAPACTSNAPTLTEALAIKRDIMRLAAGGPIPAEYRLLLAQTVRDIAALSKAAR